ncbi:MAG: PIN domain-containing protein [Pyrobaculum sp.]
MCYVLDASAFIHGHDVRLFKGVLYTTPQVIEELKDPVSRALVEVVNVVVVDVDREKIDELLNKFKDLSIADASALALALEKGCVLITDDSGLTNAAKRLGVKVERIFYRRRDR